MGANVRKRWINLLETLVCRLGFLEKLITLLKNKVSCRDARYAWYYYYGERYLSVQSGLYFPFNV